MSLIESGSLEFALNVYKELSTDHNLVFSPLSLSICLSMLFMGTRMTSAEELSKSLFGKSIAAEEMESIATQMKQFVDKSLKSNSLALSSANFMYTQKEFQVLPKFKQLIENYFSSKLRELDFVNQKKEALDIINSDIKSATNGKIEKILEEVTDNTVMVLANALYFKGLWRSKFDKSHTKIDKFTTNSKQQIDVELMFKTETFPFGYSPDLKARAIELNYENCDSVLIILLPDEDSSLPQMRSNLRIESINKLVKSLSPVKVDLWLPKFKIESNLPLISTLKKLGIKSVFDSNSADLSGLSDIKGLYVTTAIQKAVIEVSEEGTEAAAATAVEISLRSFNEQFRANRPFMYLLVTKNGEHANIDSILFMGEYTGNNPSFD